VVCRVESSDLEVLKGSLLRETKILPGLRLVAVAWIRVRCKAGRLDDNSRR